MPQPTSKARLVITALFVDHQTPAEVAARYGVHRSWAYKLKARYQAEGEAALEARSRRPQNSPTALAPEVVDLIVRVRKELTDAGLDAGPETSPPRPGPRPQPRLPAHRSAQRPHPQTPEMTTAGPAFAGPAVADVLRHHTVAGAVCWFRTSATDVSRHRRHLSQVIGDTLAGLDARPCRKPAWSSPPSSSTTRPPPRSPPATGCTGPGSTSSRPATRPRARRRWRPAPAVPRTPRPRSRPRWST